VFASVDEADIGMVQKAKAEGLLATFSVDSHPDEVFTGEIAQTRVSSVTNQNVVTYPVVISAQNPALKLLPGMTAYISFEVDSSDDVLKIPRDALNFYPNDVKLVREADRKLIDGTSWKLPSGEEVKEEEVLSTEKKVQARKDRR
jgi:HlyD family secretion protein